MYTFHIILFGGEFKDEIREGCNAIGGNKK
jgi:hypothetical protein